MTILTKSRSKALIWASIIVTAAIGSVMLGLNQGASMGIIGGLSGAAWGAMHSDISCVRTAQMAKQTRCLQ